MRERERGEKGSLVVRSGRYSKLLILLYSVGKRGQEKQYIVRKRTREQGDRAEDVLM